MEGKLTRKPFVILLADDDEEDRMLTSDALSESRILNELHLVEDGEQLLDYLRNEGSFADRNVNPRPGLILLDLNMPKKDGREALKEIKNDSRFKQIPIVVLTTSRTGEDIYQSYDLGVNSFISKPVTFEGLVKVMKALGKYWFEVVELPNNSY